MTLLALPARLLLGAVLLYAGFTKLNDAWRFAEMIANYRLLPAQANQVLALTLPWLEVILGLLLILSVLYLPGGLASLRGETFKQWWRDMRDEWKRKRYEWSGEKARDKERARRQRYVL